MIFRDSGIAGKRALVTGGSRGIGREVVKLLAAEGADVTFFYRQDATAAREVQEACDAAPVAVSAMQVDVRDPDACQRAVTAILERTDGVDILVNNSGVTRDGLLASFSDADVRDVIDTNVLGLFHVTRAVVPTMMRQRAGAIVNIGSVSGEKGGRGQTNYAASKGAVNAFTRSAAVELAKRNVRVNAVAPGIIDTEMSREVRELAGEAALDRILARRYGSAVEVAYVVCFLVSRYGEYINGEVVHVDGGFKMA
jgi:3-oxoacyl-[acyl-carrier protein] reductase